MVIAKSRRSQSRVEDELFKKTLHRRPDLTKRTIAIGAEAL